VKVNAERGGVSACCADAAWAGLSGFLLTCFSTTVCVMPVILSALSRSARN